MVRKPSRHHVCVLYKIMNTLVIILAFGAVAYARPDVSHLPSGSYLPGSQVEYSSGSNFGASFSLSGNAGYQQDQKHIYFYAAPDELQTSRFRINITPVSQRNTKIIFVKAPTYGGVIPEIISPPSITEDRTLVYVLVKKPEQGGQITIPSGAGVKQSKPEVYFIKYKSQQDAQSAILGSLRGQPVGSSVSEVGGESNFVRTLDSGSSNAGIVASFGSGASTSTSSSFGPAGASGPY